jgi:hypothetical protein
MEKYPRQQQAAHEKDDVVAHGRLFSEWARMKPVR